MIYDDTICAISTAQGLGAIALIRLSGSQALEITDKVFFSPKNKKLIDSQPNTIRYGTLKDGDKVIDEVVVSVFKAPHSFTGENVAEIACHGSTYIQQAVLQLLIRNGARMATAGEFTMRGFMNGKMDLSQSEAIADLIASQSEASHRVAIQQMRGGFSLEIKNLREQLLKFIVLIELELDFSEEDVEFADRSQLKTLIADIQQLVKHLADSFQLGNVIKNGVPVAIVGEPNVGKSTLLNVLLNEEKAIVSDIAGTTRDSIEDVITIGGMVFRFIDTAGIRKTSDTVETLGIERTYKKINESNVVLLLVNAKDFIDYQGDIKALIEKNHLDYEQVSQNRKLIIVVNKMDTIHTSPQNFDNQGFNLVFISAKQKENIHALTNTLLETINYSNYSPNETIVTNVRHYEALTKSYESLVRVSEGLEMGISGDFLSQDIREVLHYLGLITGEISNDEVLGSIFSKFCIGK